MFFLLISCTKSQCQLKKDKNCNPKCILPFSTETQDKLYNANPYNEIYSDDTRDKGFNFEFKFDPESEDITE